MLLSVFVQDLRVASLAWRVGRACLGSDPLYRSVGWRCITFLLGSLCMKGVNSCHSEQRRENNPSPSVVQSQYLLNDWHRYVRYLTYMSYYTAIWKWCIGGSHIQVNGDNDVTWFVNMVKYSSIWRNNDQLSLIKVMSQIEWTIMD